MTNRIQKAALLIVVPALTLLWIQSASAQSWPINSRPTQSVPQYVPRYPLTEQANDSQHPVPVVRPQTTKPETPASESGIRPTPEQPKPRLEKKIAPHYGVDYSIYRDRNTYPIDPRKPCNHCVRPCGDCGGRLTGNNGKPYMESELGGCTCQKKKPVKHPQFSIHWPRPMSARLDERFPGHAAERYSPCQPKRKVDFFDHLSTFKLSGYLRTDNGHSGTGADPYGCLGESKQRSNVAGVGYRFPSEPVDRGHGSVLGNSGW